MRRQKNKSLQLLSQNRHKSGVNSATPKAAILHRITPEINLTPKVLKTLDCKSKILRGTKSLGFNPNKTFKVKKI